METDSKAIDTSAAIETRKLLCDELIRSEINGKFLAVERYDSILWKIRSGYAVVLYSGLVVLGGNEFKGPDCFSNIRLLAAMLTLIWGFSICGFLVDYGFLLSKLRVVLASNELYTLALQLALKKANPEQEYEKLRTLLQNSGESGHKVAFSFLWNTLRWLFPLYFGTPIVGTAVGMIYLISNYWPMQS